MAPRKQSHDPRLVAIDEDGDGQDVPNGPAPASAHERTALLSASTIQRIQNSRPRADSVLTTTEDKDEPLPIAQLLLICLWRATTPLFSEVILPFIAALLVDQLHVATPENVGHKSGAIQSIVAITVCVGIFPGAWLSDTIGRKPVIIGALLLGALAQTGFAFSNTYSQLILTRMLVGFCCSVIPATLKTFSIEMSTESNISIFYAIMSLGWQGGSMLAPLLGGFLSRPVELSDVFRGTIFETYPYALPSLVTALVPAVTGILGIFLAKETLPKEKRKSMQKIVERTRKVPTRAVKHRGMFSRPVIYILFVWCVMIFLICAFNSVQVLFFYTSRKHGGLGLTPRQMSFFFMLRPLLLVAYEVTVYPVLAKKYGPEVIIRITSFIYVAAYAIFLALSHLARNPAVGNETLFAGLILTIIINVIANPLFIAADQIIGGRAPTQGHIARLNAVSELLANLAAGLGLAAGGNFYAFAQEKNLLGGGRAAWLVLLIIAILQCFFCQFVTKLPGWREERATGERRFDASAARRMSTVSMYIGA